jgi:predicted Kef-type K+ transport protein
MGLTILKKKSGYVLGLILCIIGIIILLFVLLELYQARVLTSLSDSITKLSEGEFAVLGIGTGLKLIHSTFLGITLLVVGGVILVARREKIPVVEEVNVLLECPYCKNQWRETMSKPHLDSMGYPKV